MPARKPRAPSFRQRLAQALQATEDGMRPEERWPAEFALAFLSGYLQSEAPEASAALQRILERHHKRP